MGERVRLDLLSNLPLGIIHDILGRLPIREAVTTSILSRQWRYTWTTLPNLLFDDDVVDLESIHFWPADFEKATDNIINSVFSLHKGPIHRFEMSYQCYFYLELIEEWLLFLGNNDIRELIIKIDWEDGNGTHWLKSSIYTCTKLTKLELWHVGYLEPPPSGFKGFLFLTSLSLKGVCLEAVEILLANSPLLERLTLKDCDSSGRITVNAPNLKYINLCGDYTELCLYAPLLAVMHMNLEMGDFPLGLQSLDSNYVNFFRGFTNLVQLSGYNYFTRYLSIGIESCHHTLVLHHLKVIELSGVTFADKKEMMVVARLIIGAPNLHRLQISPSIAGASSVFFKDFGFAPGFTFKKLKVVFMFNICDYLFGRQFFKFLLQSSPVLETLNLTGVGEQVSDELLGFRRASPNARILVKRSPSLRYGFLPSTF